MSAPQAVRAVGRLALAACPLWLIGSFATSPTIAPPFGAVVVGIAVLALIAPAEGLLVAALLTPFGDLIAIGMTAPIRFAEGVVTAFLAGWLLRPAFGRTIGPSPPATIRYAAWGLAAIVLASSAVQALQLHATAPGIWSARSWMLSHTYFEFIGDPFGVVTGARMIEGVGLAAAVIVLLRTKPMLANWIPEALGIGCALAALSSFLLWRGIAFPAILERHALIGSRFSALVGDVNASGSYFALQLSIAAGMAARERGSRRAGWIAVGASAIVGLWLSGSRSAAAATFAVLAIAAVGVATRQWSRTRRLAVMGIVMTAILVGTLIQERRIESDQTYRGGGFRTQFAETSYRMIRARPWFGIGVGQYFPTSPVFLTPQLAWAYGGENAHNYFLQVAAEIGLAGLVACAVLVAGAGWLVARAIGRAPDDYRLVGLAAGVAAFLLTCTTGHPLLVSEVAYPFWIAAGLLLVLASPIAADERAIAQLARSTRRAGVLFASGVALLALSLPVRAREAPFRVRHTREIEGLYGWEGAPGGRRYRWTETYASVFVEGNPPWVAIPVRTPVAGPGGVPTEIAVTVDGYKPSRWRVGADWRSIRVELPPTKFPALGFRRINIRTEPSRIVTDPPGTSARVVGVQMGEPVVPSD